MTEINITKIYPLERDENYIPNPDYRQGNNANNHQNNPAPSRPNNTAPAEETDSFPAYDPTAYADVSTDNDVPF